MSVNAGDVLEVTVNHPTLGTQTFFPKGNTDSTFDPGGFRNEDDDNAIDGGGRNIKKINRKRWSVELTLMWDMNVANEIEFLERLAADPVDADFTIQHANGTVWGGKGSVVGDLKGNANTAELPVKFSGGGRLKKIVG